MKKFDFKIGDGMSSEKSTADERKEIHQLLEDNGYSVYCKTKNKSEYKWTNGLVVGEDGDWFSGNIGLTNPLTYTQMKALILGEENETWEFKHVVNAVKSGSYQIEKDCDDLDLLRNVLKEAYIDTYSDWEDAKKMIEDHTHFLYKSNYWQFRINSKKNLPIIKLSQIQPKKNQRSLIIEEVVSEEAIDKWNKSLAKTNYLLENLSGLIEKNNDLVVHRSRIGKELKITPGGVFDHVGYQCVTNFGVDASQIKPKEEKSVDLKPGDWVKFIHPNRSVELLLCITYTSKKSSRAYGFKNGNWVNEESWGIYYQYETNWRLATTEEVTEALKKEAVKRGLVAGVYFFFKNRQNTYKIYKGGKFNMPSPDTLCYGGKGGYVVFESGIWATPIETITKKQAEEKLGCRIVPFGDKIISPKAAEEKLNVKIID